MTKRPIRNMDDNCRSLRLLRQLGRRVNSRHSKHSLSFRIRHILVDTPHASSNHPHLSCIALSQEKSRIQRSHPRRPSSQETGGPSLEGRLLQIPPVPAGTDDDKVEEQERNPNEG